MFLQDDNFDDVSKEFDRAGNFTRDGKLDEAETIYRGLIEKLSNASGEASTIALTSARIGLASVFARAKKNHDEAIDLCTACLQLDGGDTKALFRRGKLWHELARQGRPGALEKADEDIQEVLRLEPRNNLAKKLFEQNQTLASKSKEDDISKEFDRAGNFTRDGKLDEAETIYRGLIEKLSNASDEASADALTSARIGLASVFARAKKNHDEAIDLCTACLGVDGGDTKALFRRGMLWQELARQGRPGALEKAGEDIKEVLRLEPGNNRAKQLLNHNQILASQLKDEDAAVKKVTSIGFTEDLAKSALKACKGNADAAIEWLLSKQGVQESAAANGPCSGGDQLLGANRFEALDLGFGAIKIGPGVWRESRAEWLGREPSESGTVVPRNPKPKELVKLREVLEADHRPYPNLVQPLPLGSVARTTREIWPAIDREDYDIPIGPQPIVTAGLNRDGDMEDHYIDAEMF